jgi:type I restriction enzyme S subunit
MSLPRGWAYAALEQVADTVLGKMLDAAKNKGELVPYLRNVNVRWGSFDLDDLNEMRVTDDELAALSVRDGDLFICEGGEPGRSAIWRGGNQKIVFQKALHRLRTKSGIEPDFVAKHLVSVARERSFSDLLTGTTIKHLTQVSLKKVKLPLPPTAEQRRIVAKLDALSARIARARAELDRVLVNAQKLRQSVVTDAFSGRLTLEMRKARALCANTNAVLESLFVEKTGSKRKKPAATIDWQPVIEIPTGWRWVSVDQVIALAQYGSSSKTDENPDGVAVLRMGNIQRGELDFSNLKYLPIQHEEFPSLFLAKGDVLFNRTNSPELVGKSAVFRGASRPVSFASYLIRLQCFGILPDLLVRYLNSPIGRSWVESVASQQVGQANVNGTKLRSLGIPLPSPEEQVEMKRQIDLAFARADRLEAEAARARKLLDRLESAILAKAFRGELVPQDPNDEPASVLLERIRAERAAAPKATRRKKTTA